MSVAGILLINGCVSGVMPKALSSSCVLGEWGFIPDSDEIKVDFSGDCGPLTVHFQGFGWETSKTQKPFDTGRSALSVHTVHPFLGNAIRIQIWEEADPSKILFEWERVEGPTT